MDIGGCTYIWEEARVMYERIGDQPSIHWLTLSITNIYELLFDTM